MTGVLIAFAIVLLVPLFVGTWRTSLLGLSLQGGLMARIALRHDSALSLHTALEVFDLVGLRMIAAPLVLYSVLRARNAPARNDVIAPNLFSWTLSLALVVIAFGAADIILPTEGDDQMLLAVSSSAFLLGLFVLSTRVGHLSQLIGLMRIENAIALFELGSPLQHVPLGIRVAETIVMLVSVAFYRWYLVNLAREESSPATPETAVL